MQIFFSVHFKRQLKKLDKKYKHVVDDFLNVIGSFNPAREISIGRSIYRIRIPSTDMNKGKSGGFRSYVYVYVKKEMLLPLCIYPKSEIEGITESELKYHFDATIREIVDIS